MLICLNDANEISKGERLEKQSETWKLKTNKKQKQSQCGTLGMGMGMTASKHSHGKLKRRK